MRYLGGKSRIAKWVVDQLSLQLGAREVYIEPFVGSGSVLVEFCRRYPTVPAFATDAHQDLILLWQALQQGWQPPMAVGEEEYKRLKFEEPSALRGFAGFGCAHGGDWFHGYAHNDAKNDYCQQSRNSLLKKIGVCGRTTFLWTDYRVLTPENALIYCDPPYADTAKYSMTFDHATFWETMRKWSATNTVIVSEYSAPSDFACIAELARCQELRTAGVGRKPVVDRLFKWRP